MVKLVLQPIVCVFARMSVVNFQKIIGGSDPVEDVGFL